MPTPLRAIRIHNNLWNQLKAKAKANGTDASEIVRQLISNYLEHRAPTIGDQISAEEFEEIANRLDPDGDMVSPNEYAGVIEEWNASKPRHHA